MCLNKTAKRRFLKARHRSGKSVVLSRFVTSVAHFLQSTLALFFYLSVVSKCPWAKKRKTVSEARHSSRKSVVFSCFGDIGRTNCTIDVRIILKARNRSGESVFFRVLKHWTHNRGTFLKWSAKRSAHFQVIEKTDQHFLKRSPKRSLLFEVINTSLLVDQ